jgi:hypothetical protein
MSEAKSSGKLGLGVLAAVAGGVLGYFAFFWLTQQRLYALVIPPALVGLAGGFGYRGRSQPFAIGCGLAGLALALVIEWKFAPFIKDGSFPYFLTHLHERKPFTLLSLVLGPIIGYRLALGMDSRSNVH